MCGADADCCFGGTCAAGLCSGSALGQGCVNTADCASPGACLANLCCAPPGTACASANDCCSASCEHGLCNCGEPGLPSRCRDQHLDCCTGLCDTAAGSCATPTTSTSAGSTGASSAAAASSTAATTSMATASTASSTANSTTGGAATTGGFPECQADLDACTSSDACCSGECNVGLTPAPFCCETAFSSCDDQDPCCDSNACNFFGFCSPGTTGDPCVTSTDCLLDCSGGSCE